MHLLGVDKPDKSFKDIALSNRQQRFIGQLLKGLLTGEWKIRLGRSGAYQELKNFLVSLDRIEAVAWLERLKPLCTHYSEQVLDLFSHVAEKHSDLVVRLRAQNLFLEAFEIGLNHSSPYIKKTVLSSLRQHPVTWALSDAARKSVDEIFARFLSSGMIHDEVDTMIQRVKDDFGLPSKLGDLLKVMVNETALTVPKTYVLQKKMSEKFPALLELFFPSEMTNGFQMRKVNDVLFLSLIEKQIQERGFTPDLIQAWRYVMQGNFHVLSDSQSENQNEELDRVVDHFLDHCARHDEYDVVSALVQIVGHRDLDRFSPANIQKARRLLDSIAWWRQAAIVDVVRIQLMSGSLTAGLLDLLVEYDDVSDPFVKELIRRVLSIKQKVHKRLAGTAEQMISMLDPEDPEDFVILQRGVKSYFWTHQGAVQKLVEWAREKPDVQPRVIEMLKEELDKRLVETHILLKGLIELKATGVHPYVVKTLKWLKALIDDEGRATEVLNVLFQSLPTDTSQLTGLIDVAQQHLNPQVRMQAVKGLAAWGKDPFFDVQDPLIAALHDEEPGVVQTSLNMIQRLSADMDGKELDQQVIDPLDHSGELRAVSDKTIGIVQNEMSSDVLPDGVDASLVQRALSQTPGDSSAVSINQMTPSPWKGSIVEGGSLVWRLH